MKQEEKDTANGTLSVPFAVSRLGPIQVEGISSEGLSSGDSACGGVATWSS